MPERWGRAVERSTVAGYPCLVHAVRPRAMAELLVDARRWAGRRYLVEGERRLTFEAHEQAVTRVAARLRDAGVQRGQRVLLLAFNRSEWVLAFWALQWLGATAVLGNAWWSAAEVAEAVRSVAPTLIVTDRPADMPSGVPVLGIDALAGALAHGEALSAPAIAAEDDPALILFSSGTTGAAKGVVMSHRSVIANLHNLLALTGRLPNELDPAAPGTVSLLTVPLFHLAGIQISLSTLLSGGSLVFLPGRFDPEAVLRLIEREGVRVWGAVPTMVSRVLDCPALKTTDVSSLRSIPMGGAAVPPELRARVAAAFPGIQQRVGSLYGLTEAGGVLAAGSGRDLEGRPQCVGRPLPVVEIRIDQPDAAGVGEILVRTPTATGGYWGDPRPLVDAEGWLRSGDLGRLDGDGRLYVVGRSKDIIIRGGENIASLHVERRLLAHPAVRECAVVALPHADLGEEVGAAVVLDPEAQVDAAALREHARAALARFEVPTRWWIRADALPTNAAGKVLKRELVSGWQDVERIGARA